MNPQEAAALLDLIIERAPALRAVGVRKVNLGAAEFEIDPDGGSDTAPADGDTADEPSIAALIAGTGESSTKERRPL